MIKTASVDTFKSFLERANSNGKIFELYLTNADELEAAYQITGSEPPRGISISALLRSQLGEVYLHSKFSVADQEALSKFVASLEAYNPISCKSITVDASGILTIE